MNALLFNLLLGVTPIFVLAASIAAGTEDGRAHRRMFFFVYGLWAISLAMWNWMRGYHLAWVAVWLVAGIVAFVSLRLTPGRPAPPQ